MTTETLCVAAVSENPRQVCRLDSPALADVGFLCKGHAKKLEKLIAELPFVLSWLTSNKAAGGSGGGEKVSGSKDAPVPIRVDVLDLADRLHDVVSSWARLICEERGLESPIIPFSNAVAVLHRHLEWVCAQPWVDDMLAELDDVTSLAHRMLPWRQGRTKLPYRCPHCGVLAVFRDDGSDGVYCESRSGGCGSYGLERQWSAVIEAKETA